MPTRITFDDIPAGVSLTAALPDENVLVSMKAYLSSEDGNDFISHLEAVWGCIESALRPTGVRPSQVDHFLAVIERSKQATLYCNELQQRALVRAKRSVQAGQEVFKDDIASIEELVFHDSTGSRIDIPPDSGIVLILSVGWRKCLYYDFEALIPETPPRSLDVPKLFGRFHQYLLFQEMYSITEEQWAGMSEWGWFPFIWMKEDDRLKIIHFATRADEPRTLFEEVCRTFQSGLRQRIASWRRLPLLNEHSEFIERAADHYLSGDYLSAIQVLYPRLEGIMRKLHLLQRPGHKPQQKTMVETLVANQSDHSLLLPARFREYLLRFYFRAFDEASGDVPLSRNTVAHGTSLPQDYDFVKASLGFMICDQMFYFLTAAANPQ